MALVDSNIALSYKSPEAPNLLAGVAAVNQLRSQQLQQQLVQQEIQKQNAEAQQQQQAVAGAKATNAAIQGAIDPATRIPDYNKAAEVLEGSGFAAQGQALRQQAVAARKASAEQVQQELTAGAQKAKRIADVLAEVKGDASYHVALGILSTSGIDVSKMSPQYNPDQVKQWVDIGYGHEQTLKNALTAAEAYKNSSEGDKATEQTNEDKALFPGKQKIQGLTQKELQQKTDGTVPLTPKDKIEAAAKQRELGIQGGRLAVEQQRNTREQTLFNQGVATNPDGSNNLVDAIGNYQIKPPPTTTRGGAPTPILNAVLAKYPDFRGENFNTYQKTENAFTSGREADLARSLNTATAHLGSLKEAGDALKNGNVRALNAIANQLGLQVGSDAKTTYDTIVHRVTPEIAKAYIPGGGGEAERTADAADFSSSASDTQRNGAIAVSAKLLQSQVKSLQDQYNRGTFGKGKQSLFTPEATDFLNKIGGAGNAGTSGSIAVTAPNGKVYHFKSEADATNFKKAAGIQ